MRKLWSVKYVLATALVIVLLDQITKILVVHTSSLSYMKLLPHLNLHLAYNRGAAFGLLDNATWARWLFVGVATIISFAIVIWSSHIPKKHKLELFALGLILGGALGNLFDRIRLGYVVDFIDFYIGNWHFYTFNIADIGVCIGAVILALYTVVRG